MKTSATEDDESGDEQRRIDACQGGGRSRDRIECRDSPQRTDSQAKPIKAAKSFERCIGRQRWGVASPYLWTTRSPEIDNRSHRRIQSGNSKPETDFIPMSLLLLTLAAYFLWSLLRRKSPLALIPGPHKDHWLTGTRLHSSLPYSTLSRQLPSPFSRRIPLQPCPGREIWRRPQGERIAWGNRTMFAKS